MANILTKIKEKVRNGNFVVSGHCLDELENENFEALDAIKAIQGSTRFDKLTDDETHIRYRIFGRSRDRRDLTVVVMIVQGTVILKTAYEDFS